jgi:hypothetical protein
MASVLPQTKMVVLVRDPVHRYESARRMYLCFPPGTQDRGETFHEEHAMGAYLEDASQRLPLQRGLYMVGTAFRSFSHC